MRLALLTDLHANREASSACLAHAERQKADQHAFTGGLVGYGADPAWVIDTVMAYVLAGAAAVQGNHDHAVTHNTGVTGVTGDTGLQMHAEARDVIDWTRGQLDAGQLAFLAGLPLTQEHANMRFVHASAVDPAKWAYVTGTAEAERSLRATRSRMVFCGHVHAPALYRGAGDGRMGSHAPAPGSRIAIKPQHQYLVIAGAVGQPRDGNCAACYAMYDDVAR